MKNKYRNTDSAIKAGDLILTEQPFAYVLSSKEKGFRCDNCLEKGKVLKCSGCQFVHYCGRACQRDAWNDHKWECSNLKRIAPKVLPDGARMLARIINRLKRSDGNSHRAFYTANSFRMWKDLMSHYSDMKGDKKRMDHFTSLCVVLYEFLKDISLPNTVELMGIYGRMVINSFTLLDTDMNSIGTGIYLACSVVDHSCNPNAVATFDGKTINIRAIQDMPCLDWNQIRISYIDLMKSPYDRQTELLESYYFLCQCDRCMDETHHRHLHAAKCLNTQCENPVTIPWKENCQLVRKPEKAEESESSKQNGAISNGHSGDAMSNGHSGHAMSNGHSDDAISNGHSGHAMSNGHSGHAISNGHSGHAISNGQSGDAMSNGHSGHAISNGHSGDAMSNGHSGDVISNGHSGDAISNGHSGLEIEQNGTGVVHCTECGTKYTENHVNVFVKTMEFTEMHLQNMKETSVAYVDVCKYCLERQDGVLHPLNVMHAQTLDHAFDALIQVQLWEQACVYAEKLIPCFKFYYGDRHPLLGLLHLKYGKILLYKMDSQKALTQFKCSQKILKMTHGERHPLYKDQLLPLLTQAMLESS